VIGRRNTLAALDQRPHFTPGIDNRAQSFEQRKIPFTPLEWRALPVGSIEPADAACNLCGDASY
jgi:hypothetical protein